ncbi:AEX-3 domain-containing protein [Dipodascopsis uninucleata]
MKGEIPHIVDDDTDARESRSGSNREIETDQSIRQHTVSNRLSQSSATLRQNSRSRSRTRGHARRMSDYDNNVIPDPEPIPYSPDMHPLDRKLDPALLDVYPIDTKVREKRGNLPDFLPMFAFPEDVQVKLADARPRSTAHQFVMTDQEGKRRYGTCLTIWIPVPQHVAEAVERLSQRWRESHMSASEREFASDLGTRLASERTKLSELLNLLSNTNEEDFDARDNINEDITATEERIAMLIDLLKPVRLGAANMIAGVSEASAMWVPRVYGLLSRDENSCTFRLEWLKTLVYGQLMAGVKALHDDVQRVPMEYAVSQLLLDPPVVSDHCQLKVDIGGFSLYARGNVKTELPGSRDTDLYTLFRSLSTKSIIELLEAVLGENRVIFVSNQLGVLTPVARAILSLIYPLKWQSVFIPVLPARLMSCLDLPVPYVIGIHRTKPEISLPDDDFVLCDLDSDTIFSHSTPPMLPVTVRNKLHYLLSLAAPLHNQPYDVPYGPPLYYSEAFPANVYVLPDPALMLSVPPTDNLMNLVSESSSSIYRTKDDSMAHYTPVLNALKFSRNTKTTGLRTISSSLSDASTVTSNSGSSMSRPSRRTSTYMLHHMGSTGRSGLQSFTNSLRSQRTSVLIPSEKRGSVDGRTPSPFSNASATGLSSHSSINRYSANSSANSTTFSQQSSFLEFESTSIIPDEVMPMPSEIRVAEGHTTAKSATSKGFCAVCSDKSVSELMMCTNCPLHVHMSCLRGVVLPCMPTVFHPGRIRAAVVRAMSNLFFNYRRYLLSVSTTGGSLHGGKFYKFQKSEFLAAVPKDHAPYVRFLLGTQAGLEFIHEVETHRDSDPAIRLFDSIVEARRKRGRAGAASKIFKGVSVSVRHHHRDAPASSAANGNIVRTSDLPQIYSTESYVSTGRAESVAFSNGRWPSRLDRLTIEECSKDNSSPKNDTKKTSRLMHILPTVF